ncbi:60S ribosomal protein L6 [Conglomerata obtusa]
MIKNLKLNLNPKDAGLYPADDIPAYLDDLKKKVKVIPRVSRTDLKQGQVVVVLEGKFASYRVIYLKQLENQKALVVGHSSASVPMFIIDERYLFATSVFVKINENVDACGVCESLIGEDENSKFEITSENTRINSVLEREVKKVKGMKRYLSTPFSVPEGKDVYAMNF